MPTTLNKVTEKQAVPAPVANTGKGPWTIAWCHTGDSGGSKRAAFEMVRELARRGHVIDEYVLRIGEPNLSHWPLAPHVRASYRHVLPQPVNPLRPYLVHAWVELAQNLMARRSLISTFRTVASEFESRGYDYVHIDHCSPSYMMLLPNLVRLPSIVYSHEVSGARYRIMAVGESGRRSSWIKRMYQAGCDLATGTWSNLKERQDIQGLRDAQLVLTNSYYSKEAMFQRAGCSASVCRYGVDTATFRPLGLAVEPMVLSAGRIVEAKQHHLAIEAVSGIPQSRRPRVVIATPESLSHQEDPAYCARVTEMAGATGVALEIRRKPSEAELVSLYNQALALLFVPIMEPFGLVALEAMACGTPVVGVREGGIRESVPDGRGGVLVERDPAEMVSAIDRFVQDRDLRNRQGYEAADYVRREWTWARSIDSYEKEVAKALLSGSQQM